MVSSAVRPTCCATPTGSAPAVRSASFRSPSCTAISLVRTTWRRTSRPATDVFPVTFSSANLLEEVITLRCYNSNNNHHNTRYFFALNLEQDLYSWFLIFYLLARVLARLFLWPALRYGTGYQTVWETRPSADSFRRLLKTFLLSAYLCI